MKTIMLLSSLAVLSLVSQTALSQKNKPGIFEASGDIGTDVKPGSVTFIPASGQYVVSGSGYNIWGDHDEFRYVWKKMKGDFVLHTRADLAGFSGVDPHRKMGWMVRKNLDGKSQHINAVVHGDGLTAFQFRKAAGGETNEIKSTLTHANIIELERKGNRYIMRASKNGEPFTIHEVNDVDLGDEVYVGLFVCSHNKDVMETGIFSEVQITKNNANIK